MGGSTQLVVGVGVGVEVITLVGVAVGVDVIVLVGVCVGVDVIVLVGVCVGVDVAVMVGVRVGVAVDSIPELTTMPTTVGVGGAEWPWPPTTCSKHPWNAAVIKTNTASTNI